MPLGPFVVDMFFIYKSSSISHCWATEGEVNERKSA